MCEYCHRYGEGEKWYLRAKNYSEDFLSDLRRRKVIGDFFRAPEVLEKKVNDIEGLYKLPGFLRRPLTRHISNQQKKVHFGQVVPIEDIEGIFDLVRSVVRIACICRQVTVGREQRYCYLLSTGPNGGQVAQILREIDVDYLTRPDTKGLESLSKEETLATFRGYEQEGLCHSVWTFIAPFAYAICNCDRSDCTAIRATVTYETPVMFRSEYVAETNLDSCKRCRECMSVCQFGAIGYSVAKQKAMIDPRRCYGCGICRAVCSNNARVLRDRSTHPIAAKIW